MGKCEDCKWFEKPIFFIFYEDHEITSMRSKGLSNQDIQNRCDEEYDVGDCHRFPPSVKPEDYGWEQINVFRDNFCGEFEAKE